MNNAATGLTAKSPAPDFAASISFRLATKVDITALVTLINAAYERERWLLPAPRTDQPTLAAEVADARTRLIVATSATTLAGCVRVRLAADGAWFGLLATAPALQGRGLASMLIAEAERVARVEGAGEMRLECADELGMAPYYASLGYAVEAREAGARFNRNDVDITRIVMRKRLAE